jgi:hypothetical protein
MSKIIKERTRKTIMSFRHEFKYIDEKNSGFSFPCDEKGNISFNEASLKNYNWCINNPDKVIDCGIMKRADTITEPAIILCDCGEHVYLTGNTNTCDNCGADYNFFGQRLADRSQWGIETGEFWQDCY